MEQSLETLIITQARTSSTRLPGKVLKTINGKELLKIHTDRLKNSKLTDKIIVATTIESIDNQIEDLCKEWGIEVSRGSENDVLDRYYKACLKYNPKWVVRVTSDCPLIDPNLIDSVIEFTKNNNVDYCSNTLIESFPDGQCIEVFTFKSLEIAWKNAKLKSEREHVTPYIINNCDTNQGNLFKAINYPSIKDYSKIRMTVDEIRDFELIVQLIDKLGENKTWEEYTKYIIQNNLYLINKDIKRNEGYYKSLKND
jgi:spore coat polysaccharide biosynthesis protein SpsF (cytidylyltransferase family)